MSPPPMTAVKVLGIPSEKLPHNNRNALLSALEEQMNVVIHQYPSKYEAFPIEDNFTEAFQELGFVVLIFEDARSVNAPHHNVMQGTRNI